MERVPGVAGGGEGLTVAVYERQIDSRGRVVIPLPLIRVLGLEFVATRAPGGRVLLISRPRWERMNAKLAGHEWWRDYFRAYAVACVVYPGTGRLQLGEALRRHAGLRTGMVAVVAESGGEITVMERTAWLAHIGRIDGMLCSGHGVRGFAKGA